MEAYPIDISLIGYSGHILFRVFNIRVIFLLSLPPSPSSLFFVDALIFFFFLNICGGLIVQSGKRVLRPSPVKALMSLTTPVTTTKFSPDGQVRRRYHNGVEMMDVYILLARHFPVFFFFHASSYPDCIHISVCSFWIPWYRPTQL